MLLRMEDLSFLDRTTITTEDGKWLARDDLSEEDKEKLRDLDNWKYWSSGSHFVANYKDL